MKVGIIGCGLVGSTAAYAIVLRGAASDIVLVDVNQERAAAEAADIQHSVPFVHPVDVWSGEYEDLAGCGMVIITAGVAQKPGESRLDLMGRNATIMADIVPRVLTHAPEAILLVVTNPVDVMTHLVARLATEQGLPSYRVIGSGTTLDTARFRSLLGGHLDVDPQHVHGYVIGEHGDSEVLSWSLVDIGGIPLEAYARMRSIEMGPEIRYEIDQQVRGAAYQIIAAKGATYYGIGAAVARIVDVVAHGHRAILTVCTPTESVPGVGRVTVSLPHLLSADGVMATLPLQLSEAENQALTRSGQIIRNLVDEVDAHLA